MAIGDIGKAEIEVVADTKGFPESARRGVEESFSTLDPELKKAGEEWGNTTSKGFGERIKSRVPEIIRDFGSELRRQKIREHLNIDIDTDVNKDNVRTFVKKLANDIENEVSSGGGGGPFGKVGQTIFDAVGSAFNVSGRSPLVYILIPAIGALGALITAAIEAVYGLAAALLTIPNLLAAIGVQGLALYLIFQDVGSVFSKALAAQNAKELADALKGVNLYIQNFALELVYIRDAFKAISQYLSIEFFKNLGNVLLDIFDYNRYTLFTGLLKVAGDLGTYFATVGKAFESPEFAKFLFDLFQQIDIFLKKNGPVLQKFLTQVFGFLDSLMGATGNVGKVFNDFLTVFGNWLEETAKSKEFQDFLKQMPDILRVSGQLIAVLADLFISLFTGVNEANGKRFISDLIMLVEILAEFLSSQAGVEGLKAIMGLLLVLTAVFEAMIIVVLGALGAMTAFFEWIFDTALPAVGDFFSKFKKAFADGFNGQWIKDVFQNVKNFFTDFLPNAISWGGTLISNFIKGVLGKLPDVKGAFSTIASAAAAFIPHSPAKMGPFSGTGAPYVRGQTMIGDFAKGIMAASDQVSTSTSNAMSNVNFGTGAVIANFYGAQPTQDQARGLGTAVGNGIGDQLLARNVRLAVRTM